MNQNQKRAAWIRITKLARGCKDCRYRENADGLQFDHLDGSKAWNISQFIGHSMKDLRAELEKCDVRCANCHAIRSASVNRVRNRQATPSIDTNDIAALVVNLVGKTGAQQLTLVLSEEAKLPAELPFGGELLEQLLSDLQKDPEGWAYLYDSLVEAGV